MKLIALTRGLHEPVDLFPNAIVVPDSAITLPGRPLFVPDFAPCWEARIMVGVRVSRLGKGIAPRFAPRYYDAITLLLRLIPTGGSGYPGALAAAFDGCIQQGEWIDIASLELEAPLTIDCCGERIEARHVDLAIDEALAAVARYTTIRNGDIICSATLPWSAEVAPGHMVEASIGQPGAPSPLPCLHARLK
ncbi:MAG: hypothetical protein K1V71_06340 [Paramuribaculum sp.]